jgi:uncharacterized protein YceH (UPF0502 family)
VQKTLDGLIRRDDPLVVKLERQPGQKEARYAHLMSGEIDLTRAVSSHDPAALQTHASSDDCTGRLETEVERLRNELAAFRAEFDEFRKQFD